jgi:hypothetical protein
MSVPSAPHQAPPHPRAAAGPASGSKVHGHIALQGTEGSARSKHSCTCSSSDCRRDRRLRISSKVVCRRWLMCSWISCSLFSNVALTCCHFSLVMLPLRRLWRVEQKVCSTLSTCMDPVSKISGKVGSGTCAVCALRLYQENRRDEALTWVVSSPPWKASPPGGCGSTKPVVSPCQGNPLQLWNEERATFTLS